MPFVSRDPLVPREEVEAVVAARRELGREHEVELVDSFLERIERAVERRAAERAPVRREDGQRRMVLALVSLVVGVPLTAIALATGGLAALLVVWAGVVLVNGAVAWRSS